MLLGRSLLRQLSYCRCYHCSSLTYFFFFSSTIVNWESVFCRSRLVVCPIKADDLMIHTCKFGVKRTSCVCMKKKEIRWSKANGQKCQSKALMRKLEWYVKDQHHKFFQSQFVDSWFVSYTETNFSPRQAFKM